MFCVCILKEIYIYIFFFLERKRWSLTFGENVSAGISNKVILMILKYIQFNIWNETMIKASFLFAASKIIDEYVYTFLYVIVHCCLSQTYCSLFSLFIYFSVYYLSFSECTYYDVEICEYIWTWLRSVHRLLVASLFLSFFQDLISSCTFVFYLCTSLFA